MMQTYREKTVRISAIQWDGTNLDAIKHFVLPNDPSLITSVSKRNDLTIDGGFLKAKKGDWIIRHDKNNFSSCANDDFQKIYSRKNPYINRFIKNELQIEAIQLTPENAKEVSDYIISNSNQKAEFILESKETEFSFAIIGEDNSKYKVEKGDWIIRRLDSFFTRQLELKLFFFAHSDRIFKVLYEPVNK